MNDRHHIPASPDRRPIGIASARQSGVIILENALFLPIMILLLFGMIDIARITYTYYSLEKTLNSIGRILSTQQGVNFCDDADATVAAAKTFAVTGSTDGSTPSLIRGLTTDQIQVRIERRATDTGDLGQCTCDATGCDTANGGQGPDFIVVSIPDGYPYPVAIPQIPIGPILLKPRVRVPYQGT